MTLIDDQPALGGSARYRRGAGPPETLISSSQDGLLLPPLLTGARVTLDITSVGQANPGSDLTVIIRL